MHRRLKQQVLATRQQRVEARLLQRRSDRRPHVRAIVDDVEPGNARRPGCGWQQRGKHVNRRRLPRAVRPQEPVYLARPHLQVDAVDRPRPVLEHARQRFDFDR